MLKNKIENFFMENTRTPKNKNLKTKLSKNSSNRLTKVILLK